MGDCKRQFEGENGPAKRLKIEIQAGKNALQCLNEYKPGLKYVVESSEGPPHNRVFVMSVKLNDSIFIGKGRSKQQAKHDAAEKALKSLIDDSYNDKLVTEKQNANKNINLSITKDKLSRIYTEAEKKNPLMLLNEVQPGLSYHITDYNEKNINEKFVIAVEVDGKTYKGAGQSKKLAKTEAAKAILTEKFGVNFTICGGDNKKMDSNISPSSSIEISKRVFTEAEKKNPVMLLNELRPGLSYRVSKYDEKSKNQRFFITVEVDGEKFNGAGQSKKIARSAAARAVLSKKFGLDFNNIDDDDEKAYFDVPKSFADDIAKLVHEKIDKFIKKKFISDWTVLAGIVMTTDAEMKNMELICIATSSNTIDSENLSFNGAALNDCHAEVIVRRCLKDYLFSQLELHSRQRDFDSIFEKIDDKFHLKPNIKFHFYVSSLPCGDAATSAVHDDSVTGLNSISTDQGSGMLQAKTKIGTSELVGSILEEQNIEAIRQKLSHYHIMSCSDKIATWNVLGIQGSLLNYFINPIYINTIIIGQQFHNYRMLMCIFKRIEDGLKDLPARFTLHKPKLVYTSDWMAKSINEIPKESLNWICGQEKPELIIGLTGKPEKKPVSRLAKRSFFQRFTKLLLPESLSTTSRWYSKIKKSSPYYSQAKHVVIQAFASKGFGQWRAKPDEQDVFDITF